MEFRRYKEEDAEEIINWIKNENDLYLWSANVYNKFPIKPEDINNFYKKAKERSNFYPMTLIENNEIIGHLILRNPDEKNEIVRLGFVIVKPTLRGKGYGKELIRYAIKFANKELNAKKINLGVFENNKPAYNCYKAAGFIEDNNKEKEQIKINNEEWTCVELIYNSKINNI